MKNIRFEDFVMLCQIYEPENWGGYRVDRDGVYIIAPDDDVCLTPDERFAIINHPTGELSEPLLKLPCTVEELRTFLAEQATGITVEDEDVAYKRIVTGGDKVGDETPAERGARLLQWQDEEEKRGRGGLARVAARESERRGKPVDRSNLSKEIKTAREKRNDDEREGKVVALAPHNPFGIPTITKVIDGKRQS